MIADMINNKKLNSKVIALFIRGRKLNILLVFITQSYFKVPKELLVLLVIIFIEKKRFLSGWIKQYFESVFTNTWQLFQMLN